MSTPSRVLSRLRTDLPTEAALPTPPPVPTFTGAVSDMALRPADPQQDAPLVADWMSRPHLAETWEQPWSAGKWADDWRAKLATTYAVPLILSWRGHDVGYMEIYRPHRDEIGRIYRSEPHDLGIHIGIGEPDLTGRGIFGPFLGAVPAALFAADRDCRVVVGEPDHRNAHVHAALGHHGWTDCGEHQQRADRRVRLFLAPAEGQDAATRLY
jgi:RimJ/RimL family protein N-acetyltransferase